MRHASGGHLAEEAGLLVGVIDRAVHPGLQRLLWPGWCDPGDPVDHQDGGVGLRGVASVGRVNGRVVGKRREPQHRLVAVRGAGRSALELLCSGEELEQVHGSLEAVRPCLVVGHFVPSSRMRRPRLGSPTANPRWGR